jgi:hypothetical protein
MYRYFVNQILIFYKMKKTKLILILFGLSFAIRLNAQKIEFEYAHKKHDSIISDLKFYVALTHQHQDFFNKAFSFQGIETGLIINHKLFIGAYGSTFVSKLKAKLGNNPLYAFIAQGGFLVGAVYNDSKVLHAGWLLNMGYFSLKGDNFNFDIFKAQDIPIKVDGIILSPQIYAELNATKWMKLRTGLAYSFYSFENHSVITKSDLQNISFTFGFIFGKFN